MWSYSGGMRPTRVLPVLAAAALSLGLLAGCGQQAASDDLEPVAALTDDSFASTVSAAVADAGSAHVAIDGALMGMPLQLEGDVAGGDEPADLTASLASADGGIDVRLVDQVAYALVNPFTGGQFWRIDLTDSGDPLVAQLESFRESVDVDGLLDDLDGALSVEASGDDAVTLDGVETTAYAVTVDVEKLAESTDADLPSMPSAGTFTVYLGPDDLPRRVVADVAGAPVTIDFSAWGDPVEVDAPPADQVSDQSVSDLLGGFLGSR